ncbi:MAG: hypothetical protein P1V97_33890, partial [Planctomycetota bacterium]|nr:hypothetical protein [Planctomycetota bacterium]
AKNAYIYSVSRSGGDSTQVNSIRLKATKTFKIGNSRHLKNVVMAADGRHFVFDSRGGGISPSGADVVAFNEKTCELRVLKHLHRSFGIIHAGPSNRYWLLGSKMYASDLKSETPIRIWGGAAVRISSKYNLVASVNVTATGGYKNGRYVAGETSIVFQSLDSGTELKKVRINIPKDTQRRNRYQNGFLKDVRIQFDNKNDRLFVGYTNKAWVVDLASSRIPRVLAARIKVPSEAMLTMGKPFSMRLRLSNRSQEDSATFKIVSGPKGLRLSGNTLQWTPGAAAVGRHSVVLSCQAGKATDKVSIVLEVSRTSIVIGGTARAMSVSPNGQYVLVKVDAPSKGNQRRFNRSSNAILTLIDLKSGKKIASRQIDKTIVAIHVSDSAVYYAPNDGNVFYSLNLSDLSDKKRKFVDDKVTAFAAMPQGRLLVISQSYQAVFNADSLEMIERMGSPVRSFNRRDSVALDEVNEGLVVDGAVLDRSSGKPTFLFHWNVSALLDGGVGMYGTGRNRSSYGMWARRVQGSQLSDTSQRSIAQWRLEGRMASKILRKHPALASVEVTATKRKNYQEAPSRIVAVIFRDLVSAEIKKRLVLRIGLMKGRQGPYDWPQPMIHDLGDSLIIVFNDRVFTLPLSKSMLSSLPKPLHFSRSQKDLTLEMGKTLEIPCQTNGGKGATSLTLHGERRGLSLDKSRKVIVVDSQVIWKKFLKDLQAGLTKNPRGGAQLKKSFNRSRTQYKSFFGITTTKIPLAIPYSVSARDEEGQTDKLSGCVLMLVPPARLDSMIETAEKDAIAQSAGPSAGTSGGDRALREENLRLREELSKLRLRLADTLDEVRKLRDKLAKAKKN